MKGETLGRGYLACVNMNIKMDKLPCCGIIVYNPKHKHGKYVLPLCGEGVADTTSHLGCSVLKYHVRIRSLQAAQA